MSKVLKIVGTIAAAVAIVATAGAALAGTGMFLGMTAGTLSAVATIAGIAATAANIGAQVLTKPPPARGSVAQIVIAVDPPRPFVAGEGYVGGMLRYDQGYGATINKVPNPYLWQVYVYNGVTSEEVAPYVDFAPLSSWYTGFLTTTSQLGLCPEAAALSPTWAGAPGWDGSSKLSGEAAIGFNAKFDKDGKRFANGLPVFGAYGKWAKAYDPRLDSTWPGGSGAHRSDDESTWEWTETPALIAGSYALGYRQNGTLVMGMGLAGDAIDWDYVADWANVCEANEWTIFGRVFEPVGPEQRWANLKDICAAGGGVPIPSVGGRLSFHYPSPKISLGTITEDDRAQGRISRTAMKGYADRINSVIPRYIEPDAKWDMVQAEKVSVAAFVTDDGEEKLTEWPFNLVKDVDQAAELAGYKIWESREETIDPVPLLPQFRNLRPGECWTFDFPSLGLAEQDCVITSRTIDPGTFAVSLKVETETAAKHAAVLGTTGTPPPVAVAGQTAEERDALAAAVAAGAVDAALGSGGAFGYISGTTSSTSMVPVSDVLTVVVGASGTVDLYGSYSFGVATGFASHDEDARWYDVTSGATALDTGATTSTTSAVGGGGLGEGTCGFSHTGQTVGATKLYQLYAANAAGTVTRYLSGTVTASST